MNANDVDALDAAVQRLRDTRPAGSEPEVTSRFGIEAENIRLKDELRTTRLKLSRLKAEVRRLNDKVTDLKTAYKAGFVAGTSYEVLMVKPRFDPLSQPKDRLAGVYKVPCDISNNPMDTGD